MEVIVEVSQKARMLNQGGYSSEDPQFWGAKVKEWNSRQRNEVIEWVKEAGRKCQRT